MSTTQSLNSLGHLAPQLLRSVLTIRRAIGELGLQPAVVINDIEYYDDSQAEQLRVHLERRSRASHTTT